MGSRSPYDDGRRQARSAEEFSSGDAHARASTRRLIRRRLHPTRRWDARSEERLQSRLDEDSPEANRDRAALRRSVVARRLLLGAAANQSTRVEDERRLDALLDRFAVPSPQPTQASPTPHPRITLSAWFSGLAGLAALLLMVLSGGGEKPSWAPTVADDALQARGGDFAEALVGFGVTGVTEGGDEYEVLASDGAHLGDYLRFSYTNDRPADARFVFIFGLQRDGYGGLVPRWYVPEPQEARSAAIGRAQARFFDFETRLSAKHQPGPLRFVAVFTREPLTLATVAEKLADLRARDGLGAGFESWLRTSLGLPPGATVQLADSNVVEGTFSIATPQAAPPSPEAP